LMLQARGGLGAQRERASARAKGDGVCDRERGRPS
jgi:hypothetical protein